MCVYERKVRGSLTGVIMALGRPGLEPCVPLEVRFRAVIDQWSRARDRIRLSVNLVLPATFGSKNDQ